MCISPNLFRFAAFVVILQPVRAIVVLIYVEGSLEKSSLLAVFECQRLPVTFRSFKIAEEGGAIEIVTAVATIGVDLAAAATAAVPATCCPTAPAPNHCCCCCCLVLPPAARTQRRLRRGGRCGADSTSSQPPRPLTPPRPCPCVAVQLCCASCQEQGNHAVEQLDRVHVGSACGAEDDVELGVEAARRRDRPAPCRAAAHRASREGSATDKGRAMVLVNVFGRSVGRPAGVCRRAKTIYVPCIKARAWMNQLTS